MSEQDKASQIQEMENVKMGGIQRIEGNRNTTQGTAQQCMPLKLHKYYKII